MVGESYCLVAQPGKVLGFADGDVIEAVDAECDRLDIDR